jgi:serine/threonine-protein kinase RsbW
MPLFGEKEFPADLDSLKGLRDYVSAAAEQTAADKKKVYKLQLAVDEIATNIIAYGYAVGNGSIFIDAEIKDHSLVVQLRDQGIPFDPRPKLKIEQESIDTPVEKRRIGGLGIYLAITGVDSFAYEYRDGFNVNQFEIVY